jgi:hypothetical protein
LNKGNMGLKQNYSFLSNLFKFNFIYISSFFIYLALFLVESIIKLYIYSALHFKQWRYHWRNEWNQWRKSLFWMSLHLRLQALILKVFTHLTYSISSWRIHELIFFSESFLNPILYNRTLSNYKNKNDRIYFY